MVAVSGTCEKIEEAKQYGWAVYTLTWTSADSFTISDFVSTENLKNATFIQNSDGAEVAVVVLNNKVTLGGAVTDVKGTLFVFGVRT